MTHLHTAHRARPHAGVVASAVLTTLNFQSLRRHRVRPDIAGVAAPQAEIVAAAPMPAVCVLVPELSLDDAAAKNAALTLLTGSTMNGRYVDEAAAKKLLAHMKSRDEGVDLNFTSSPLTCDTANKAPVRRFSKLDVNSRLHVGHHHEPRRVAGVANVRGEHVAMH